MAGRGKANSVDFRVGTRLRLRRTDLGLSQEELGHQLGLTFQQIQKYEGGTNRISASYLYELTRILRVPVSYFFDGPEKAGHDDLPEALRDVLLSAEGLALWRAFSRIQDGTVKSRVLALVKAMSVSSAPS